MLKTATFIYFGRLNFALFFEISVIYAFFSLIFSTFSFIFLVVSNLSDANSSDSYSVFRLQEGVQQLVLGLYIIRGDNMYGSFTVKLPAYFVYFVIVMFLK